MNAAQANALSMSDIFNRLGYQPQRIRGRDAFFFSPLRRQSVPGFHVDLVENVWYDFALDRGGDVVDFAVAFLQATSRDHAVDDALRFLSGVNAGVSVPFVERVHEQAMLSPLEIERVRTLDCLRLRRYLTDVRKIPFDLAQRFLVEVEVRNVTTGKAAFMLGMRNADGVFVLGNAAVRCAFGTADVTVVRGSAFPPKEVHVFGDALDMLSALADQALERFAGDAIVLHTLSHIPLALPYIEGYESYRRMFLWLDNDRAGEKATDIFRRVAQREAHLDVCAMNPTYSPFGCVNAYRRHRFGQVSA